MKIVSLDTNLLVLYCIGAASEKLILTHKRVQNFTIEDFRFITDFLSSFDAIVSTPYSLAEVSNLLNISSRRKSEQLVAQTFVEIVKIIDEIGVSSRQVSANENFVNLGLADTAWLEYLGSDIVFLSTDEALVNFAKSQGKNVEWIKPSKQQ